MKVFSITLYFAQDENKLLLVEDECSLWYNGVGGFLKMSVWERRKEIAGGNGSVSEVSPTSPHSEVLARLMALSAMADE